MDAAVAGRLRPADEPNLLEQFLDGEGNVAGRFEVVAFGRVEVDPQLVGMVEVVGAGVPGVEIDAVLLGHPDDVAVVEREEHAARTGGRERDVDQGAGTLGPLDEQRRFAHAGVPSFQHGGPVAHAAQRSLGAHQEVLDHVELGPALLGEHDLVRARDANLAATGLDVDLVPAHRGMLPQGARRRRSRINLRSGGARAGTRRATGRSRR